MGRSVADVRRPALEDAHGTERILSVENLSVDLRAAGGIFRPVRGVSFHVDRGETLGVVGESGCGKSLTALALMNLLPAGARRAADRLSFLGLDLLALGDREVEDLRGNRMAMIFQDPMTSLNPAYTVGSQLEEVVRRHRHASSRAARTRVVELCERVGITPAVQRLRRYPHELSGGLCQRVMIAMALLCEPALVIADEPTTALDVTQQAQILRLLMDLQRDYRLSLILITHDLAIVAQLATRVLVLYAGQIVESATTERLFRAPRHPYTRALLACVPSATAPGGRLGTLPGMVPAPFEHLTGCRFANRCPLVVDACRIEPPILISPAAGHAVRCPRAPVTAPPVAPAGPVGE